MTFGEYRALVGLLEHLRFITQLSADATNPLYRPHQRAHESAGGPGTIIRPTELMRQTLSRWLAVIMQCAGAIVTIVFSTDAAGRLQRARVIFSASSDAAGDGRGTPGFGGYMHGHFWRVAVPLDLLALMHITAWETLAACVNTFVAGRLTGGGALLAMQVPRR